ncbi:DUF4209 domain-containing protein [Catenuloplanes japonicus]|uniref:DUF4209 domain-containing protein n=1 Tax=Catenuloplanes japonicus TaxID=33876 RepID=UPI000526FBCE|nr:DUF4209 domain-containing protein [Catenuloplanes japonicus]
MVDAAQDQSAGGQLAQAAPEETYRFEATHTAIAIQIIDRAFTDSADRFDAMMRLGDRNNFADLGGPDTLYTELSRALAYHLVLFARGEDPGCTLEAEGYGVLQVPAITDVPDPVLELWRAVAAGVTPRAAVALFSDLLWSRRGPGAGAHGARAASAYLDLGGGTDELASTRYLVRAWTIAREMHRDDLDEQIRERMAKIVTEVLNVTPGQRPGVTLPLLGALARGPLRKKRMSVATDPVPVDELLERAANSCVRGPEATEIARYRRPRATDTTGIAAIDREEIAAYRRDADAAGHPAQQMLLLRDTARVAADRGHHDLARGAAAAMQQIAPDDLDLQTFTSSTTLPAFVVDGYLSGFTSGHEWSDGMNEFLTSECPTGNIVDLRRLAIDNQGLLSRHLPSTLLRGGLPRATTTTPEEIEKHEMSRYATPRAEAIGRLLAEGLDRIVRRYGTPEQDELVRYLMSRGGRDQGLVTTLAKAYRHFWNGDYESCIHLATPKFEAAARALLIEFDEGIYQVEATNSPGGFPGLYALLNLLEKEALDESWAYFFGWLLGGPWGANLRNDVAHGLPAPMNPAYAALVLRAVTCLGVVAGPVTSSHLPVTARRAREEILATLVDPTPSAGHVGNLLGRLASDAERLAWWLRAIRLRWIRHT